PDDGRRGGWTHYEFARAIGAALRRRPFVWRLSARALHRSARVDGWLRGKGAKLTPDRAAYFSHPDWVVSYGAWPPPELWHPRVEKRQGFTATAEWYRAQGWLKAKFGGRIMRLWRLSRLCGDHVPAPPRVSRPGRPGSPKEAV